MLEHLLRPFSYLAIDHGLKWKIDWLVPVIFAFASVACLFFAGTPLIFGDGSIVAKIQGFVQNLPGFYIAALAAIATFNRDDIDRYMPEPTPRLEVKIQGKNVEIKLTRRRFLCSMFAFLTAESILIIILAIFGVSIADSLKLTTPVYLHAWLKYGFLFAYLLLFWQMLVASFWGLYYLGEKLHQPDQQKTP